MGNERLSKHLKIFLSLAVFFHFGAALFTEGYFHPDEHYQILEFANFKMGLTPLVDMPWEYHSRIRPWFQPMLALGAMKAFHAVGLDNPFYIASLLRCFTALLWILVLLNFVVLSRDWFKTSKHYELAVGSLCLLWFLPFIDARFSSESLSGSLFFLGFCPLIFLIQKKLMLSLHPKKALLAGLFWGLAFHARYQIALAIVPAFLWFFIFGKPKWKFVFILGFGFLVTFIFGLYCDAVGYGNWHFTPWEYFKINIIEGKAKAYGVQPFWYYAYATIILGLLPIGLLLVFSTLAGWFFKPKLSLTWVTLPFILIHSLLAHKEIRFLFPVVIAIPILFALCFQVMEQKYILWYRMSLKSRAVFLGFFKYFVVPINIVALLFMSFCPPRTEMGYFKFIYAKKMPILYTNFESPYYVAGILLSFYRPRETHVKQFSTFNEIQNEISPSSDTWFYFNGLEIPNEVSEHFSSCRLEYKTLPDFALQEPIFKLVKLSKIIGRSLYVCNGIKGPELNRRHTQSLGH